jgi:hypothetical protein
MGGDEMRNTEMHNVKCFLCNVRLDVEVIEEDDILICDVCAVSLVEIVVKYDGSEDLLAFLKTEVNGRRCMSCLEPALVLNHIKFGMPVEGFVHCMECNKENEVSIHIEFV